MSGPASSASSRTLPILSPQEIAHARGPSGQPDPVAPASALSHGMIEASSDTDATSREMRLRTHDRARDALPASSPGHHGADRAHQRDPDGHSVAASERPHWLDSRHCGQDLACGRFPWDCAWRSPRTAAGSGRVAPAAAGIWRWRRRQGAENAFSLSEAAKRRSLEVVLSRPGRSRRPLPTTDDGRRPGVRPESHGRVGPTAEGGAAKRPTRPAVLRGSDGGAVILRRVMCQASGRSSCRARRSGHERRFVLALSDLDALGIAHAQPLLGHVASVRPSRSAPPRAPAPGRA